MDAWTLRLAAQRFEESRIARDLNSTMRSTQSERVVAYSLNWDCSKEWNPRHKLFYGIEGVWNDVLSQGIMVNLANQAQTTINSRYPQATWFSAGLYATEAWSPSPKTTITSGIRLSAVGLEADFSNNMNFVPLLEPQVRLRARALTNSIGFTYRPSPNWVIKSNLGTAFRAPNVDDLGKFFDTSPSMVVVPNPNLRPEHASSADFDVARLFGTWFKIDLAGYATLLRGALVRRPFSVNGIDSVLYGGEWNQMEALQNASFARVLGLYFGLEAKLSRAWSSKVSYNVQKGVEGLDNGQISPSRHAPPAFGWGGLTYRRGSLSRGLLFPISGSLAQRPARLGRTGQDRDLCP